MSVKRGWVKKYGPALLVSLRVLKVACGVGRLAGLPLPVLPVLSDFVGNHTAALTTMYNQLKEGDRDLKSVANYVESRVADSIKDLNDKAKAQDVPESLTEAEEGMRRIVKGSYMDMKAIATDCKDPDFRDTGLVVAYHKGQGAFVHASVKDVYEREGKLSFQSTSECPPNQHLASTDQDSSETLDESEKVDDGA